MGLLWCRPKASFFNFYSNPLRHALITLPFILTHLTLSYPLPWPPLPIFLTRPPSPIPPMPTQKKIRPRRPVWLPVGAARSYRAPENLMPSKFGAPAATGACCAANGNRWGSDPHWFQTPLLTVLRAGGALSSHPRPGGARIWPRRAPQSTGALALLRRTPAHAAVPPTHTHTRPQHSPQLPPTISTHAHWRWPWWGCGGSATTPPWPIYTPHNPPTQSPPHTTHTHCMHVHTATHTHTHTHPLQATPEQLQGTWKGGLTH